MDDEKRKHLYMFMPIVLGLLVIVVLVLKDDPNRAAVARGTQTVGPSGSALKSDAAPQGGPAPVIPVPDPAVKPPGLDAPKPAPAGADDLPKRDPNDWLTDEKVAKISKPTPELIASGKAVFKRNNCATCHIVPGGPRAVLVSVPIAGWRKNMDKTFNADMFDNQLWRMMARKNANTKRAISRMRAMPRGDARLAVWLDEKLNEPMFDKGKRYRLNVKMPSYKILERSDREALMAYLFSIE